MTALLFSFLYYTVVICILIYVYKLTKSVGWLRQEIMTLKKSKKSYDDYSNLSSYNSDNDDEIDKSFPNILSLRGGLKRTDQEELD